MGDKYKKIDGAVPRADIELSDRKPKSIDEDAFDVRVLDVKKAGAPTIIRVPKAAPRGPQNGRRIAIENAPPTGSDSSATAGRSATAYCRNLTWCHAHRRPRFT